MTTHAFSSPFVAPFNPFLPTNNDSFVDVSELEAVDAKDVSYALVQSGPSVSSEETECAHVDAVEVKISWGTQVLSLSHIESNKKNANKSFSVGEGADFELPNVEKTSVVSFKNGSPTVSIPMTAVSATVSAKGEHTRSINAGDEVSLIEGMSVRIEASESITIEVSSVRAGKKTPVGFLASLATGAAAFIGLSFVGHAAIVASLAMFMPKMNADDAENIGRDQMMSMKTIMNAAAEREQDALKDQTSGDATSQSGGAPSGERHDGPSGIKGDDKPVKETGRMSFKGSDNKVQLTKKEEKKMAEEFGMIGIALDGAPKKDGQSSPWGKDTAAGDEAEDRSGQIFGSKPGDWNGTGWDLSGTGEGGGGKGTGVGLKKIGTVGGGEGGTGHTPGRGDKDGWGNGTGPGGGHHVAKAPIIRTPDVTTNGRIPAEVIQRIVRQNFGRFRLCYEAGLRNNPSLNGRVVTKFVIDRNGAVSQASDGGSDLANQEVVSCIVRSFNALSFPAPEGGIATVSYPIVLSPGE